MATDSTTADPQDSAEASASPADGPVTELAGERAGTQAPRKRRRLLLWLTLVGIIGLVVLVVMLLWSNRLPSLTEQHLRAAIERWEQSGIRSYTMDIEISGRRAGQVRIEVENGVVVHFDRDGYVPRQRRTWDVWSVPGQFDMIWQGLEMASESEDQTRLEPGTRVLLRARFHEEYGYPVEFSQAILGGGPEFAWRVVRFEDKS